MRLAVGKKTTAPGPNSRLAAQQRGVDPEFRETVTGIGGRPAMGSGSSLES